VRYLAILILAIFAIAAEYTNDLIYEESPYLRQHAHNPVNWLPWGKKAFEKAKKEHKPIFLSIGYSTCHWCHVMERESFENEEIAKLLNKYYVPVKVDREERPDLDRYYQTVFSVIHHRSGGWPLTIIMTEDKKPFFAATYIPPEDGYGVKGMKTILPLLAKEYRDNRAKIEQRARAIEALVKKVLALDLKPVHIDTHVMDRIVDDLEKVYDKVYGGFSKRIKFPQASTLELLLDIYELDGDKRALTMALHTLKEMAKSGLFDQIEGGFFRYTTDRAWSLPHFEKMLYTNAELIGVYTHAYKITKDPFFAQIVRRTIQNVEERFSDEGLYYSASNAESQGEEGRYFLIRYDEALKFLIDAGYDPKKAEKELAALDISEDGNFDGDLSHAHLKAKVDPRTLRLLKKFRSKRPYPFIDKKIITAWNALYIKAKFQASIIDPNYSKQAKRSLDRLIQTMDRFHKLYHQKVGDNPLTKEAFLEDYAFLIDALIEAYNFTQEPRYLDLAKNFYKEAKQRFYKDGRWYFSLSDHKLPVRRGDSYYRSPYATLINALLELSDLTYDRKLRITAKRLIDKNSMLISSQGAYYPTLTQAYLRYEYGDVVIKGKKDRIIANIDRIFMLPYPFLLASSEDVKDFEACTFELCFASGDLEAIKEKILQKLGTKKSQWKIESLLNR